MRFVELTREGPRSALTGREEASLFHFLTSKQGEALQEIQTPITSRPETYALKHKGVMGPEPHAQC